MCCCQNFVKGIFVFAATLSLSILAVAMYKNSTTFSTKDEFPSSIAYRGSSDSCFFVKPDKKTEIRSALKILSKPGPKYTDAARNNMTTGTVRLRVTFLASGKIGNVESVTSLPDGLTEQAISAAKNIKFNPATIDEKPMTVTKLVEYSFSIY